MAFTFSKVTAKFRMSSFLGYMKKHFTK